MFFLVILHNEYVGVKDKTVCILLLIYNTLVCSTLHAINVSAIHINGEKYIKFY